MSNFTLALLKPDLAVNPAHVKVVLDGIRQNRLSVVAQKVVFWNRHDAEIFYEQHKQRFFYGRLVEYTSSGPMLALLLSGTNAIQKWRTLMGPTKTFKAAYSQPNSMRAEFGLTDTRNSTHGSDSTESALAECKILFGKDPRSFTKELPGVNQVSFGDLATSQYWEKFYNKSENSEWFSKYKKIKTYTLPTILKAIRSRQHSSYRSVVVDIGCGVSAVGPHIAKATCDTADVYCIDFVREPLVKLSKKIDRNVDFDNVTNFFMVQCDVTSEMPFDQGSVTAILDKGCIDSILRQNDGYKKAVEAIQNNLQLLHVDGVFLQMSDEPPDARLDLLNSKTDQSRYDISCQQLLCDMDTDNTLYLYTIRKIVEP